MRITTTEDTMKSNCSSRVIFVCFASLLLVCALSVGAAAQTKSAAAGPMAFDTPQQAADALIKATGTYDVQQMMAIFGADGEDFVSGGDQVQDKNNAIDFAKEATAKNSVAVDKANPNRATRSAHSSEHSAAR